MFPWEKAYPGKKKRKKNSMIWGKKSLEIGGKDWLFFHFET